MNEPREYPTGRELKSVKAPAVVAVLILLVTVLALVLMLGVSIAGGWVPAWLWPTVLLVGVLGFLVAAMVGGRKPKGRAKNLTSHPPTTATPIFSSDEDAAVEKVVNRIKNERSAWQ